jgi:hypothetical protein
MLWNQCTYEWYNSPTKYYFWFGKPHHIFAIPTKGLRSTRFNIKKFHEILHIHKRNHKEQSFPSKFSIFLKVMEFR